MLQSNPVERSKRRIGEDTDTPVSVRWVWRSSRRPCSQAFAMPAHPIWNQGTLRTLNRQLWQPHKREHAVRFILGFLAALAVVVVAALAITYSGSYNVAANVPDAAIVKWFLATNMERSVMNRARGIKAPAQLTDEQARQGFRIYK